MAHDDTSGYTRQHHRLVRFFRGDIGEGTYDSVVLKGPEIEERGRPAAYLTLDGRQNFRFARLSENRGVTREWVLRSIETYNFPVNAPSAKRRDDHTLWLLAEGRTNPVGLPLAIFLFSITSTDADKVVFWYPRTVPGQWMLGQCQRIAFTQ